MSMPFEFPEWMPWWLQLLVVVIVLLLGLAIAFMPFSVFGVKSRLEAVENRLDEIQTELRNLVLRLPEPGREPLDTPAALRASAPLREPPKPAPIPPTSWEAEPARESRSPTLRAAARVGEAARERAEPRLVRRPPG